MIHPQIEKLLDLLSNDKKVKVVTIKDFQKEIKMCLKDALREALNDIRHDSDEKSTMSAVKTTSYGFRISS